MPLNDKGQEVPDQTPIVIRMPSKVISHWDDVRSFIKRELSGAAAAAHVESFEEANDFDIDDDPPIPSRWEYSADQEEADRQTIQEHLAPKGKPTPQDQTPAIEGNAPVGSPTPTGSAMSSLGGSQASQQPLSASARKVDSP